LEFMTAAAFQARPCPTWLNEIKKTKRYYLHVTRSWHKLFVAGCWVSHVFVSRPIIFVNRLFFKSVCCRCTRNQTPYSLILFSISTKSFLSRVSFISVTSNLDLSSFLSPVIFK